VFGTRLLEPVMLLTSALVTQVPVTPKFTYSPVLAEISPVLQEMMMDAAQVCFQASRLRA
jgi:hypothetical protein